MKFKFRLQTIMKQRKVEQDVAQRDHASAVDKLQAQLQEIQMMYTKIDDAKKAIDENRALGGACTEALKQIDEFILGQKIRIQRAREQARELMKIEEAKLEILVEKMRDYKVIEKLKALRETEFKDAKKKKIAKDLDDLVTTRFRAKG